MLLFCDLDGMHAFFSHGKTAAIFVERPHQRHSKRADLSARRLYHILEVCQMTNYDFWQSSKMTGHTAEATN